MARQQSFAHPSWCDCAHSTRPPGGWHKHELTLLADDLEVDWSRRPAVVRLEQADTETGLLPAAVRFEVDGECIYLDVDAAEALGRALLGAAATVAAKT